MANGSFGGGDGTASNPYLVEDAYDLDAIRNYLGDTSVHFKQVADIDMSVITDFLPIQDGTSTSNSGVFRGTYDGNGFSILNLSINQQRNYVGLFGIISGATLKNITITNSSITGQEYVGILIGQARGDNQIENCHVQGTVSAVGYGGLFTGADYVRSGSSSDNYSNCSANGTITSTDSSPDYIGGFIGYCRHSFIDDCHAIINIDLEANAYRYIGGFVGYFENTEITNSTATGTLNAPKADNVGGFCGYLRYEAKIMNCRAEVDVTADQYIGGFVGYFGSRGGVLENCSSENAMVISNNSYAGGFVGRIYGTYPTYFRNCHSSCDVQCTGDYAGGFAGRIEDAEEGFIEHCYATGNVVCSRRAGGFAGSSSGLVITTPCFATGNAETTNSVTGLAGGFIGQAYDTKLEYCYAKGNVTSRTEAGGFIGELVDDSYLKKCYSTGTVTTTGNNCGGLIGYLYSVPLIEDCYSTSQVISEGNRAGGLVGGMYYYSANGLIQRCYASGDVRGYDDVAGLFGVLTERVTAKDCFALNKNVVYTRLNADHADIAGDQNDIGTIENCYSLDSMNFVFGINIL